MQVGHRANVSVGHAELLLRRNRTEQPIKMLPDRIRVGRDPLRPTADGIRPLQFAYNETFDVINHAT